MCLNTQGRAKTGAQECLEPNPDSGLSAPQGGASGAPSPSCGKFQGEEGPTLGSQGRMGQGEGDKVGGVEVSPWSLPGASRRYLMEREKSRRWEAVEMAKGGWAGTGRKSTRAAGQAPAGNPQGRPQGPWTAGPPRTSTAQLTRWSRLSQA